MKETFTMTNKKRLGIYLPVILLTTLTSVVLRTVAAFLHYDKNTGYYNDKLLINASVYILLAALIFTFTHIFFSEHSKRLVASFSGPETYVPSGIVICALAFYAAESFESFIAKGGFDSLIRSNALNKTLAFEIALAMLAVAAIAYFALTSLITDISNTARAIFGICAVSFFALASTAIYFDASFPINAPNKLTDQMAHLFVSLFFIYEIRISLGRELWAAYRTFGMIGAALAAYSSIPAIIFRIFGGGEISSGLYGSIVMLSIFIFILCRLILSSLIVEDTTCSTVTRLKASSEERSAAIESRELLAMAAHTLERDDGEAACEEEENAQAEDKNELSEGENEEFEPIQLTIDSEDN